MLFQRWSNGGERITDPGTRQGFWVFSPGGAVLGRCNTRSPERVLAVLDAALERWEALPAEDRGLDPAAARRPGHRWEDGYPEGGLALARVSRDVSADGLEADPSNRWNRDTLWCSAAELAGMLRRPGLAVEDALDLQVLADRLARFSLVDDARGQTLPYAPAEVQLARLTGEVVAAGPGGSLVVELVGETRAVASEEWLLGDDSWRPRRRFPHGIRCRVVGRAEVDPESWLTAGVDGREMAVLFSGSSVLMSTVRPAIRLAPEGRLRLGGLLWPEARARIADSAWLTDEPLGDGRVITFAVTPVFRGSWRATTRLLGNAIVLSRRAGG